MRSERLWLAMTLLLLVPIGFFVKFSLPKNALLPTIVGHWCCLYGAAILYEVFWVVFLRFCLPKLSPLNGGLIVLTATCILEILQLWQPSWLTAIRNSFWGAALLGTTFDPWDFPHYVIGTGLGMLLLSRIVRWTRRFQVQAF